MPLDPVRICQDTWLLPRFGPAPPGGGIFVNSAVITAREPVVVDTGSVGDRQHWLAQLSAVLDPVDVRWIFITHDDPDHVGNLPALLQLCPRAVVLTGWLAATRLRIGHGIDLPVDRVRSIDDGDTFDVGDRTLQAVLPPVFDNPTTRGLFDPTTGFYWAADCFAAALPRCAIEADDVPAAEWRAGFLHMQRQLYPWHTMLDPRRHSRLVDRVQQLGMTTAAGAHGPVVRGTRLDDAIRMLRELPHLSPPQRLDPAPPARLRTPR